MAEPPKPPPTLTERAAAEALEQAANRALDAVERLLFGKVGGAEEVLRRETAVDPLDRLRAEVGVSPPAAPEPPREDPEAEARRQLEELKRQRAEARAAPPAEPPEIKKTL